jgi:Flp pilus assembly protein TadB
VTAAVAWLLLGSGVLFLPPGPPRGDGGNVETERDARRAVMRARAAVPVAVGAAGAGCLAALSLRTGLLTAAVVCPSVAVGVRWLQRRPSRPDPDNALPLVLDLAAAVLRSGRPVADALALAAPAGGPATQATLLRVAGLSRLGADAPQAWSAVPRAGPLGEVAGVAVRSAASGIKLAAALERLAAQLRAERRAAAAARAARAGVTAMAPLAACFLPSFVCLGVIPVIVGVAKTAFGVLP